MTESKRFWRSPYWLWSCLLLALQLAVFLGYHHAVISTAGVKYRGEDATFITVYYFVLSSLVAVALTVVANGLRRRKPRLAALLFAAGQWLYTFLLWLNLQVYTTVGVHLSDPILAERLRDPQLASEIDLGGAAIRLVLAQALKLLLAVAGTGAFTYWLWKRWYPQTSRLKKFHVGLRRFSIGVTFFWWLIWPLAYQLQAWSVVQILGTLPLVHLWDSSRKWVDRSVNYLPEIPSAKPNGKTLVVMGMESFRWDNWNAELMPLSWKFFKEHPQVCAAHTRHYAPSSATESGVFTLIYGLNSNNYRAFRKLRLPSFALDHLKSGGYRIEGYASGRIRTWSDSSFVFSNFDSYEEFQVDNYSRSDLEATREIIKQLREGPQNKFVFGFWSATHSDYSYPPDMEFYKPVMPPKYQGLQGRVSQDEYRTGVKNRYKNSVRFADKMVHEILRSLEPRLKKGDIEIVFTGDHGEEFWDHGQLGHASPRFYDERIRVPLLWCGSPPEIDPAVTTSHVDILPTLLAKAGLDPQHFPKYFSGLDLTNAAALRARPFVVNVAVGYPQKTNLVALVDSQHRTYWMQDNWKGFELLQITDGRGEDLPITPALRTEWERWLPSYRAQLNQFMR